MPTKNIAIIPARGGSKRIPNKNIKDFNGIPALTSTLKKLVDSSIFSEIVVTTDSPDIKNLAEHGGATKIVNRNVDLSGDFVPTVPVIADAIRNLELDSSDDCLVCCVYPINPFLDLSNLLSGLEMLKSNVQIDYVNPIVSYPYPIERALEISEDGVINMSKPQNISIRSQDLKEFFHDAGQWYWGRSSTWLHEKPLLQNSLGLKVSRWHSQDIDTIEDWKYAELLFKVAIGETFES